MVLSSRMGLRDRGAYPANLPTPVWVLPPGDGSAVIPKPGEPCAFSNFAPMLTDQIRRYSHHSCMCPFSVSCPRVHRAHATVDWQLAGATVADK